MPVDKHTKKIQDAQNAGRALTGSDFRNKVGLQSTPAKTALGGLLKQDRTKTMTAMEIAEAELRRRRTMRDAKP